MNRLWPRSLAGQVVLLLTLALLAAQAVSFALILNERQKLSLARIEAPAIARFVEVAADLAGTRPEFRDAVLVDASRRGARFTLSAASGITEADRDPSLEARLAEAVRAESARDPVIRAAMAAPQPAARKGRTDRQVLRFALRRPDGQWLSGQILTPRRDPLLPLRLAAATLILLAVVLGVSVWIALRLARPLRDLTRAAESFGGRGQAPHVEPSGPDDLRSALSAFNAMNDRLVALLDEKDRMLGAIGHDLRTPLASLRIRLESMGPEEERAAAIAKVEELAGTLEDILTLARAGRARDAARPVDVAALVDAVVEEHRALGHDVLFEQGERAVVPVQAALIRRAVDNLISNAVRYAGSARVAVRHQSGAIAIEVVDDGPGIPPEELERVLQPFYRLERSRGRNGGGTGLGLAITQSIGQSHGGRLQLFPARPSGEGLRAVLELPISREP